MNQQTNYVSLVITLIAALNTAAMSFGVYHFTDEQLDSVVKIVSIIGTIVGVFMSHKSPAVEQKPVGE